LNQIVAQQVQQGSVKWLEVFDAQGRMRAILPEPTPARRKIYFADDSERVVCWAYWRAAGNQSEFHYRPAGEYDLGEVD
jgi:hypothetical protein